MIWENIVLAASSLKTNKTRALLTMLGIIIGISSVIAIVSIGTAMKTSLNSSLTSFGTANVTVAVQERGKKNTGGGGGGPGDDVVIVGKTPASADLLTDKMISDFKANFTDVIKGVSLSYSGGGATARDMELYANVAISGINEDYSKELTTGRLALA